MTTTPQDPLTVTFAIGLDTPISDRYTQTGEDSYSSTPVTVLDAVVERAAQQLSARIVAPAGTPDASLTRELRERAYKRIDDAVTRAIEPIIAAALEGEVQQTNQYGEPKGGKITLRELVIEEVGRQLHRTNGRSSFDSKSVLDEALKTTAKSVVAKELADEIAEAKQVVKDALASSVAETMADTITKAMAR